MARNSKIRREHFNYFVDVMTDIEWDLQKPLLERGRVPPLWHEIARDRLPKRKVKVTLGIEEDVVRFFRSMGRGYQVRMNDVLRAWMHGRIADLIEGPDAEDRGRALRLALPAPRFGDSELVERSIVRRKDGTLWHLDEERVVTWEEIEADRRC